MSKGVIDFDDLSIDFREGQIEYYSKEFNGSKTQALLYLWLFNNFSTCAKEVTEDCGRPMYRKLVESLSRIIKEQSDEKN